MKATTVFPLLISVLIGVWETTGDTLVLYIKTNYPGTLSFMSFVSEYILIISLFTIRHYPLCLYYVYVYLDSVTLCVY